MDAEVHEGEAAGRWNHAIQRSNAGKSVIRSRVEHVFADQKSQTGLFIRTVGITRTTTRIGLANIVYNMRRFLFLERLNVSA